MNFELKLTPNNKLELDQLQFISFPVVAHISLLLLFTTHSPRSCEQIACHIRAINLYIHHNHRPEEVKPFSS